MEIEIKGKTIELNGTLPLKLKDWRILEKKGVNISKIGDAPIDGQIKILSYVLAKVDSTITEADVEDLDLNNPAVLAIMGALNSRGEVDRPFLAPSTS